LTNTVRLFCKSCSSQEQLSNAKRRRKKEIKVNEIIDNLIDQKGYGVIRKESLPHIKTILGVTRWYPYRVLSSGKKRYYARSIVRKKTIVPLLPRTGYCRCTAFGWITVYGLHRRCQVLQKGTPSKVTSLQYIIQYIITTVQIYLV